MYGLDYRLYTPVPAPVFAMERASTLGPESVIGNPGDFLVRVGPWSGFVDGDQVFLTMGRPAKVIGIYHYVAERDADRVCLSIPSNVLPMRGPHTIAAHVMRDGKRFVSALRSIMLDMTPIEVDPELLAPWVEHANGNSLNPSDGAGGVCVRVPPWPDMDPADECELLWLGIPIIGSRSFVNEKAFAREASGHGGDLRFPVPAHEVKRIAGGYARIGYRVTRKRATGQIPVVGESVPTTCESAWLDLSIEPFRPQPDIVIDDLNDASGERFEAMQRPFLTFSVLSGHWSIGGGKGAMAPFHDGRFIYTASANATMRVDLKHPCESVRFGYGAGGPGAAGSVLHVGVFGETGDELAEVAYSTPKTGVAGLWVNLQAREFGAPIGAITLRKEGPATSQAATALFDNFTMRYWPE
ncbi:hypothetical protein KPL74_06840 [Bacillus sp. NP157]|nr:hypothetical protein KPL74_06840 [Bacillus sp. NP157]